MLLWLNLCQIVIVRVTGKVISHNSCFYILSTTYGELIIIFVQTYSCRCLWSLWNSGMSEVWREMMNLIFWFPWPQIDWFPASGPRTTTASRCSTAATSSTWLWRTACVRTMSLRSSLKSYNTMLFQVHYKQYIILRTRETYFFSYSEWCQYVQDSPTTLLH